MAAPHAHERAVREYRRPGKHTVRVGDLVRVARAQISVGERWERWDKGWTGYVLGLTVDRRTGRTVAKVTRGGGLAGVRFVAADRLTRKSSRKDR